MPSVKSLILKACYALVAGGNFLLPKRHQLLLHSFPDVEDQLVSILRWLRDHPGERCAVIFLTTKDTETARLRLRLLVGEYVDQVRFLKKTAPAAIWCYWRSAYVFFTHGLYGFMPVPRRQCVVNLWHGMPIKKIWGGLPGSPVPQCRWLLSTSEKYSIVQAAAARFSTDKVPALGLPRNDLLFSKTAQTLGFNQHVRAGVERVILFLPTYRQSKTGYITCDGVETASALAMTEEETSRLKSWLAESRTRILVKPHPMSVHYGSDSKLDDRLWLISDTWLNQHGVTLYEALGRMDGLITDVSSVYVDFLSLRRPVFFYFPDLAAYKRTRNFELEPVAEWLAGPLCETVPELLEALQGFVAGRDEHAGARERLAGILNPSKGPDATDRLFSFLRERGVA